MFPHQDIPVTSCPKCGTKLSAVSRALNETQTPKPSPGDVNFCLECCACLIFQQGLTVRVATPTEMAEMALTDPAFLDTFAKVRAYQSYRAKQQAGLN
jgi:hypothetical protein